jgi:hypothetical protein
MKFEDNITLEVRNWPRFARVTTHTLDARLFPDEASMREHAHARYGHGVLRHEGHEKWVYTRRLPGPPFFWAALARILNKSYL